MGNVPSCTAWRPALPLAETERRALLGLARRTIETSFPGDENPPGLPAGDLTPALVAPLPCFVSLHSATGRLRGCIGCLSADRPLHETVARMAQRAAFHDPRFPALSPTEAPNVEIRISVLGEPKPLNSPEDLVIGRHGLVVSDGLSRGVLLAEVATEQSWSREEFLAQTCLKAGLDPASLALYRVEFFDEESFS